MNNAQKNQDLQNKMQALIKARYDGVLAVADPTLPPAIQEAIRNRDTSMLDFEITNLRQQLQGRSTDQTNALQYLVSGYQADVQATQQRQAEATKAIQTMLTTYGSALSDPSVGVTQQEIQQWQDTGVMPPALATKLMKASTITETKAAAAENKPFLSGQRIDPETGIKLNVYSVNQFDPKTKAWTIKEIQTVPASTDTSTTGVTGATGGITFNGQSYDTSNYAVDPSWGEAVQANLSAIGQWTSPEQIDAYIQRVNPGSPVTSAMIQAASSKYGLPWEVIGAVMQHESNFGTSNVAQKNNNVGGITWTGSNGQKGTARPANEGGYYVKYATLQDGIDAMAQNLAKRKVDATTGLASTPLKNASDERNAQDLASGKMTLDQLTQVYPGRASTGPMAKKRSEIVNRAKQINPDLDLAKMGIQYKFASGTNYSTIVTSIGAVMPNIDKIVQLSDAWNRSDMPAINRALRLIGWETGDETITNLKEAQSLIGDEIGKALSGTGATSDFKIQFGFDALSPEVSPENFTSNMALLKEFLQNKLDAANAFAGSYAVHPGGSDSGSVSSAEDAKSKYNITY